MSVFLNILYDGQVEKNNGPRQDIMTTPLTSQATRIQSVPLLISPENSQRREVLTQLTYDSPVSSSQPVPVPGMWMEHGRYLVICQLFYMKDVCLYS